MAARNDHRTWPAEWVRRAVELKASGLSLVDTALQLGREVGHPVPYNQLKWRLEVAKRDRRYAAGSSPVPVVADPLADLEITETPNLDQAPPVIKEPPAPTPPPAAAPTPPTPIDPLATAQKAHRSAAEKRDLKREHKALLEENERLARELAAMREVRERSPEILVYKKAAGERADAVACAIASDWHVEEPVTASDVHGLNEYNLDIAKSRAEHYFKNLLRLADTFARDSKITTVYIAALGDFFSGFIHEELMTNTLLAPADAARFVEGLLASGIDFLLKESSYVIDMDMLPGNHGRMTKQMHFGDPTGTSLESFMYHSLAQRYHENPRVHARVADRAMVYRKFFETMNVRLIHGYEIKYGGGVGGLTIPLNKALAQWDKAVRADLTLLGHFHQFLDSGRALVNGSLIGYNTFAQAIKAEFEDPRQAFFLIHARAGGEKAGVHPIWLEEKKTRTAA